MAFSRACVPAMIGRRWWDIFDYPPSVLDQHFGNIFLERDLRPPTYYNGYLLRPRSVAAEQASGKSEVVNEKDKFQIKLAVRQFQHDEIQVKVVDNYIVIHCKHGEISDDHGFIQREFTRRYVIPEGAEAENVTSSLSESGILTIEAPKKVIEVTPANERVVPISVPKPSSRGN